MAQTAAAEGISTADFARRNLTLQAWEMLKASSTGLSDHGSGPLRGVDGDLAADGGQRRHLPDLTWLVFGT